MKLISSFKYAFRGFLYCVVNERNMRIHTVAALYVLFFSYFFSLPKGEVTIILLSISSVISSEMINTAIESISDLYSCEYNPVIRVIKDIAAGAVVCCAAFSLVIGIVIFGNAEKFFTLTEFYSQNLDKLFLLIGSFLISVAYVFYGPVRIKNRVLKLIRGKRIF